MDARRPVSDEQSRDVFSPPANRVFSPHLCDGSARMNLALFDFDGTLTDRDSYSPFVRIAVRPSRMLVGRVVVGPMVIAYDLALPRRPPRAPPGRESAFVANPSLGSANWAGCMPPKSAQDPAIRCDGAP